MDSIRLREIQRKYSAHDMELTEIGAGKDDQNCAWCDIGFLLCLITNLEIKIKSWERKP